MRTVFWSLFATCMVMGLGWAWAIHEGGAKGLQRLVTLIRGIFWGLCLYLITGSIAAISDLLFPSILKGF